MSENWEFYFSNINNAFAALFVDLGLRSFAPDKQRPYLLWVWIYFQSPRKDGLSSNEEANDPFAIEDTIVNAAREALDAIYVGRITTSGRREVYFYANSTHNFSDRILNAMKQYPKYKYETGSQLDEHWSQYHELLYPSPEQFQSIENRKIVEELEKHGDSLSKARPVKHWIYFKTESARDEFLHAVKRKGFRLTSTQRIETTQHERPLGVVIERKDKVDWQSIDEVVIELFRLAVNSDGDYDGWETSVEH